MSAQGARLGGRLRGPMAVAAAASGGAGLVHIAAARDHAGSATLTTLFALTAAAQLGWAATIVVRPRRSVLLIGLAINSAALAAWVLSRTTGWLIVDAVADPEPVGTQDAVAALLAAVAIVGMLTTVVRPRIVDRPRRAWSALASVAVILLAIPALAAGHEHEDGQGESATHSHAGDDHPQGRHHGTAAAGHDGEDHEHTAAATSSDHDHVATLVATHDHTDSATHGHVGNMTPGSTLDHDGHDPAAPGDTHEHPAQPVDAHDQHRAPAPTGEHDHVPPAPTPADQAPTGPVISLDDPRLTPGQRAAARDLIDRTAAGMAAYPTVESVVGAGYESIGDGRRAGGFEHFVRWSYLEDGRELDASRIESIVARVNADGSKEVVSAMYILEPGKGMSDVPDVAGPLATWHDHQNLCWEGNRLAGRLVDGQCQPGGELRPTPPMLHVWMVEHPCGPFAGIEGHGAGCGHAH